MVCIFIYLFMLSDPTRSSILTREQAMRWTSTSNGFSNISWTSPKSTRCVLHRTFLVGPTDQLQSKTNHHRLSGVLGAVTYETIQKVCVCVCLRMCICVCVERGCSMGNHQKRRRSFCMAEPRVLWKIDAVGDGALGHLPQPLHSMGEVGDGGVEEGLSWEYCGSIPTSLKHTKTDMESPQSPEDRGWTQGHNHQAKGVHKA